MEIREHRLHDDEAPVRFVATPNVSEGTLDPRYLVVHYTAGRTLDSAVGWLSTRGSGASAHLVIGRGGEIVQVADFDRIAWHAGRSRWRGLTGLNRYAIGIELDNAGDLRRQGGRWRAWFGGEYPDDEVVEAAHKHDSVTRGWHVFTAEQIAAAAAVARLLVERYDLRDVIGHDDIAPGRKLDPGPAFPLAGFRNQVMGHRDDALELFETTAVLNFRTGPGVGFETLPESPLAVGTRLALTGAQGSWCAVDLLDDEGNSRATGWVHGDFIRPLT